LGNPPHFGTGKKISPQKKYINANTELKTSDKNYDNYNDDRIMIIIVALIRSSYIANVTLLSAFYNYTLSSTRTKQPSNQFNSHLI